MRARSHMCSATAASCGLAAVGLCGAPGGGAAATLCRLAGRCSATSAARQAGAYALQRLQRLLHEQCLHAAHHPPYMLLVSAGSACLSAGAALQHAAYVYND